MYIVLEDNCKIYYEQIDSGQRDTLVFLHGNMEDSSYFRKQKEYFNKRYNLIFIDTRGHGYSEFGNKEQKYDLRLLAKDLQEVLERLKIASYVLIGFSDGANIAMEFAVVHSGKRLKGIILVGGNLRPWGLKLKVYLEVLKLYFMSLREVEKRKITALMLKSADISYKDLNKIIAPALVLVGEYDMIRYQETKKISNNLLNSCLMIIKSGNHFVLYEKSSEANSLIEDYLNDILIEKEE